MAADRVLPLVRADRAAVLKLVEDDVLPTLERLAAQKRRIIAARTGRVLRNLVAETQKTQDRGQDVVVRSENVAPHARRNRSGAAINQGHVHGGVERMQRPRMVAHAPNMVLPSAEPLIAREDDKRVLVEPKLLETVHHPSHAVVDAADLGRVASHGGHVVDELAIGHEPGMDGPAWEEDHSGWSA